MDRLYLLVAVIIISFTSCVNCFRYFEKQENRGNYCKILNENGRVDDIKWKERCNGYCFTIHPKEIIESLILEFQPSCDSFEFTVTYIFDLKSKNLTFLEVKEKTNCLSSEFISAVEFTFFKNLHILYFNKFLNPAIKNIRGETIPIKDWFNVVFENHEISVY